MHKPITNDKITIYLLVLHEFKVIILDLSSRGNLVVDILSQIHNDTDITLVNDSFLDEHLFLVSSNTPWFANIVNYLATGKLPQHLLSRENKRIVKNSAT